MKTKTKFTRAIKKNFGKIIIIENLFLIGVVANLNLILLDYPIPAEINYQAKRKLPVNENKKEMSAKEQIYLYAEKACNKHNLDKYCQKDLVAIATQESIMMKRPIGDNGNSFGPTHIHLPSHPEITKEQAMDIEWALDKTLEWMMNRGYPEFRTYAIQCHNGCAKNNGYAEIVKNISNNL